MLEKRSQGGDRKGGGNCEHREAEMGGWTYLFFSTLILLTFFTRSGAKSAEERQEDPTGILTSSCNAHTGGSTIGFDEIFGFLNENFLEINGTRLLEQINHLASFSDTPPPSVTRIIYSPNDAAARRYICYLMEIVGLSIREDAVGNIFGRWSGSENDTAVATGSHLDAIPYAGKYDGVIGVLGAIEAVRVLKIAGFKPRRSVEVIMFTSEEPTRFGWGCLGSRLLAGESGFAETLRGAVDSENISFAEAAKAAGYDEVNENLDKLALPKGAYSAFIELHIEQGPLLEQEGLPIGIVTAIAAPASLKVDYKGGGGHAGAVLMPSRNDAGLAAAELALAVEEHVLASGSVDTVGTTGVMELYPGAVNSIPRVAHVEIDVRDIDEKRRDTVVEKIRQSASRIAMKRGVQLENFIIVNQDAPAWSGEEVVNAAVLAAKQLGLQHKYMISRAYHDSLFMSRVAPIGMIFVPCYKGYSHRPDEYASEEDIVRGVGVLALTLARLSLSL